MSIRIIKETTDKLEQYQTVSIAFTVRSRFNVQIKNGGGFTLDEESVVPYEKNYDAHEKPTQWPERFDVTNWVFFAALDGTERVGGAAVAWKTKDLDTLNGRDDQACLWDIRVTPSYRGRGIGKLLFDAAAAWARERGCRRLKTETQDVNVPACRFYVREGCVLGEANTDAYPAGMKEIQLIWYLDL